MTQYSSKFHDAVKQIVTKEDEEKKRKSPARYQAALKEFREDMRAIGKLLEVLPPHGKGKTFSYTEKKWNDTPVFVFQEKETKKAGEYVPSLVIGFDGTRHNAENMASIVKSPFAIGPGIKNIFSEYPRFRLLKKHVTAENVPQAIAEWVGEKSPRSLRALNKKPG